MKGEIPLELPRGRARRLAIAGGTLGFAGLGAWLAIALVRATGARDAHAIALLATTLPIALAISIALPPWILRLRAPREARIVWDREVVRELDGDAVRTAIRWRDARGRIEERPGGRIVQITDAEGRAITAAEHGATPPWLARRAASAADLAPLAAMLSDRDPGPPIAPDERDARRPVMGAQVALLTVAVGVVGGLVLAVAVPPVAPAFAALIACVLCALPVLRPLHELAALIAESRRTERAEDAEIEDPDPVRPILRRADRSLVRVDLSRAKHPDALLGEREDARVRVVLPISGWIAAPTRAALGEHVVEIDAIETPHERAARAELTRAVALELVARCAAVLFWAAMSLSPLWL